jgi:hypothetical protein
MRPTTPDPDKSVFLYYNSGKVDVGPELARRPRQH